MKKAIIQGKDGGTSTGEVINIIECTADSTLGMILPLGQFLWDCTDYMVALGDTFIDGVFYRASDPVKRIPTVDEKVSTLSNYTKDELDGLKKRQDASESAIMGLMQMQMPKP